MEGYLGEIRLVAYPFQPRGWLFCNGQLLSIASNTALFSLIGTTYGGNGQTTFAVPNFQSRVPIHFGTGPGLSQYVLGQAAGTENVTLISTQIPLHVHNYAMQIDAIEGSTIDPTNGHIAQVYNTTAGARYESFTSGNASNPVNLAPQTTLPNSGGGQPHTNIQPYLTVNFIICSEGIFPSRS